ncbi:unnamed protein product [Psylliodes chrysocephalus]|uniref:Carboxylesterase type B domain-containing protein n=1 Tax=Psylliodes chrysocephalus TaxID=3402493 RepID=A0A9P0CJ15_9CUCU|nr:unnamed protein product [Psylliodes chrysocephala]
MAEPVVEVREGKLLGVTKNDRNGNKFYGFQGIPYAKPPVGELRFKAPQPPEPWEGIRDAKEEGSECFARHFDEFSGSEDCLVLNVYTKEILSPRLRPVMFWIHGGGFTGGSSSTNMYGPEFLLTKDVVLVSINYRVGALGFLNLPDPELGVPGNAGLKDMVMALKWVQNNIKQFSGDPNNVTVFGESAGGSAAQYLVLSPMAKGLFHKIIAQSGSVTNCWATSNKNAAYLLAANAGIYSNNDKVVLKHLQQLSLEDLQEALSKIPDMHAIGILKAFGPTIEKNSKEEAFISEHPLDIIKSGNYMKVPMIMGCVSREGMYIHALVNNNPKSTALMPTTLIPNNFQMRIGSNLHKDVSNKIKKFYFGDKDPSTDKDWINKLYTDNYFLYDVYKNAKCHLETNTHPIYFYRFLFDTDLNFLKHMYGITEPGVSHADDTPYLFKCDLVPEAEEGSVEDLGIRRMVTLWTNFAKYGKPTIDKNDSLLPVEWLPISKNKFRTYDIGTEMKLHDQHPETKYMEFWDEISQINPFLSKL